LFVGAEIKRKSLRDGDSPGTEAGDEITGRFIQYSGPLPHPTIMNKYDKEAQKTILTLAVGEQKRLVLMQVLAFFFASGCLLVGFLLVSNGRFFEG